MSHWEVVAILCVYVVGFFATAGAAGTDIASNCRNDNDVHTGGITGILLPTVLAGEMAMLIIAGAYGGDMMQAGEHRQLQSRRFDVRYSCRPDSVPRTGKTIANIAMIALAISSFPAACFSSLIAANSFKTTMPKVNPFHFRGRRRVGGRRPGRHRLGRRCDFGLRGHRGLVRTRLRRHARRFPDGRPKMVRPEGRFQPGGLDLVDRRIRRRRVQSGAAAVAQMGLGHQHLSPSG